MSSQEKRSALVQIDNSVWAQVKHFSTMKRLSVNNAVQVLLQEGLCNYGYDKKQNVAVSSDVSLVASNQQTQPLES
jgi:hypothetical protein